VRGKIHPHLASPWPSPSSGEGITVKVGEIWLARTTALPPNRFEFGIQSMALLNALERYIYDTTGGRDVVKRKIWSVQGRH